MNWFMSGGPFMWPILLIAIYLILLNLRAWMDVRKGQDLYQGLTTILVLGIVCPLIGSIGQVMGLTHAMAAIITASDISPEIVTKGFQMAMIPTEFGLFIFFITLINWLVLNELNRSNKKS